MATYRLTSHPDAPPELLRSGRTYALVGTISVAVFATLLYLQIRWIMHPPRFFGHFLLAPILTIGSAFAMGSILLCGISVALLPRQKREYGQQSWTLNPEGLHHAYPGRADAFTPADALRSFSVHHQRIIIRAAAGSQGSSLPRSLANADAFLNQLRAMGIPEESSRYLIRLQLRVWLTIIVMSAAMVVLFTSHNPALVLLTGLAYTASTVKMQWNSLRRGGADRTIWRNAASYFVVLCWLLVTFLRVYEVTYPHHHHLHRAESTGPSWIPQP